MERKMNTPPPLHIREGGEIWMQVTSNENNFGQLKGENR